MIYLNKSKKGIFSSYNFAPTKKEIIEVRQIVDFICEFFQYKKTKWLLDFRTISFHVSYFFN